MKNLYLPVITIMFVLGSCAQDRPVLKIGLVADPQYADQPAAGERYYRESIWKLKEATDTFNFYAVDMVQNLGDIIDGGRRSYDSILPVYKNLNPEIKNYHLLGNHDFAIDSVYQDELLHILSMPGFYYSYREKGWRFIVLDATDYSFFSNYLHHYEQDKIYSYFEKTTGKSNNYRWNSAIGNEQQNWLKQELSEAKTSGERVIVYSHLPVKPFGNEHNLWNDSEITAILEKSGNVIAFINGHNHGGGYLYDKGIHYINLHAMVQTKNNSYAILEIYENRLVLNGYGNQKDLTIDL